MGEYELERSLNANTPGFASQALTLIRVPAKRDDQRERESDPQRVGVATAPTGVLLPSVEPLWLPLWGVPPACGPGVVMPPSGAPPPVLLEPPPAAPPGVVFCPEPHAANDPMRASAPSVPRNCVVRFTASLLQKLSFPSTQELRQNGGMRCE